MSQKPLGKKAWMIADGFWHSVGNGLFPSHEAVCVLNTSDEDATIRLTLFFEDKEEMTGLAAVCPARRTRHIRMDKLETPDGRKVPRDVPYAILAESDVPVVVQYSRMDTSQKEMALMSTIAYPIE